MKVNETKLFYEKEIKETKEILGRLLKGQKVIEDAAKNGSIATAMQGVQLYNQLSQQAFEKLELCMFYHEFLCLDKTVVIKRNGKAINIDGIISQEEVEINPFHLRSIQALKDVLGEDFLKVVEFR
jgi:hypothetical protein